MKRMEGPPFSISSMSFTISPSVGYCNSSIQLRKNSKNEDVKTLQEKWISHSKYMEVPWELGQWFNSLIPSFLIICRKPASAVDDSWSHDESFNSRNLLRILIILSPLLRCRCSYCYETLVSFIEPVSWGFGEWPRTARRLWFAGQFFLQT